MWTDPEFDPTLRAFYYARVIEDTHPAVDRLRPGKIQTRPAGRGPLKPRSGPIPADLVQPPITGAGKSGRALYYARVLEIPTRADHFRPGARAGGRRYPFASAPAACA